MKSTLQRYAALLIVAAALLASAGTWAALAQVGPVDPATGFPMWYSDTTGISLEFGIPLNQAEIDGGWVLLDPGITFPETFGPPVNFSSEHFYWAGNALIDFSAGPVVGGTAKLILAVEAAFATGAAINGDQVTFGRLRIEVKTLPFDGTYTVTTPYGTFTFLNQLAGAELKETRDIGIGTPGFTGALASDIGPYLLPSLTPGGAELPPVIGPVLGKLYIADPGRLGPVTGSPTGNNIFRITGPLGFDISTTNFSLTGRLFDGTGVPNITVDRANYTRTAAGFVKTEVFATGIPTVPPRLPGSPVGVAVTPVLSYFNAPPVVDPISGALSAPVGVPEIPMAVVGNQQWARSFPATLPTTVTIKDISLNPAGAFIAAPLTDQVSITSAFYDGGILTVAAVSSDLLAPGPTLTLDGQGPLAAGQIVVTPLAAPPAVVTVSSTAGGVGTLEVTTGFGAATTVADTVTVAVNVPATINVLANDTIIGVPVVFDPLTMVVTITVPPVNGVAVVNANGTIGYTPNAAFVGADSLTYTLSVNGVPSDPAVVTINVADVLPPTLLEAEAAILTGAITSTVITGFTGTGFVDFVAATGESIEWSVTTPLTGQHTLEFRYALAAGSRPMSLTINGTVVPPAVTFASTGAWTTWSTLTRTVNLTAGVNTIRVTSTGTSGPNIDSLTVASVITTPPPGGAIVVEAENALLSGPVISTAVTGFVGTGFVDYVNASTDFVEFTVNAAAAGPHTLAFRYALAAGNRPMSVSVNGTVANAALAFPSTGSWTTWSPVTMSANLNAGANTIRLTATGASGPNVDNLTVTAP